MLSHGYFISSMLFMGWAHEVSPLGPNQPTKMTPWSCTQAFAASSSRRDWLSCLVLGTPLVFLDPSKTLAEDFFGAEQLEMKTFEDPLFAVSVPKSFFTLRRTQKGDLPDAKTGKGRRGSSIFTAGNMAKAEVIAVERYPVRVLLEENGIQPTGDLTTFPALGDAVAVANLIVSRREKDSQQSGSRQLEDVRVSPDGKELTFRLRTEIEVQKPELLLQEFGVSQLFRITVAKASLSSVDGNLMAIFASALEQDYNNGVDGPALEASIKSFKVNAQTSDIL